MLTASYPLSLVNQLAPNASTTPQGYYRSKLFITPFSTNPLIAAAGPLLSLLERLCLSTTLPSIEEIRENIEHETRAFYSKLTASNYARETVHIANYLLCATVDEILGKSYLRIYGRALDFKAFTPTTSDGTPPEQRFFEIVTYIKERPNQFLDLVELVYFCLIVGFEGEYHLKVDGRQTLDNTIEDLYQIIQQHRFNKTQKLFNKQILPKITPRNFRPLSIVALAALSLITITFIGSHLLIESKAKSVLAHHTQLAMLDN